MVPGDYNLDLHRNSISHKTLWVNSLDQSKAYSRTIMKQSNKWLKSFHETKGSVNTHYSKQKGIPQQHFTFTDMIGEKIHKNTNTCILTVEQTAPRNVLQTLQHRKDSIGVTAQGKEKYI